MKVIKLQYCLVLLGLFIFTACKKDNNGPNDPNNPDNPNNPNNPGQQFPGEIIYDWATEGLLKINLQSHVKSTVLPDDTRRNGVDISQDGKRMIVSSDAPDNYDANLYTFKNVSDGAIISQFEYYPTDGGYTIPNLSYDETLIAINPTYDDGIVILNMKGQVLHHLASFQGKKIEGSIAWMPDNTILFKMDKTLYRTNAAFTQANAVKTLNYDSWGGFAPSPDGTKIALTIGNHAWMMNADGTNLVQVTTSDFEEAYPTFSPDSKYLLLGREYQTTGPFGHIWYMVIIPADGKQYNVNEGADDRVIPVIEKGENRAAACGGLMLWR